ncbi:general substrate transporter [Paraphoma chrysanthemicola]|uniref:General substrate transporter n=1 Tax=Paraphoma chrysanthemicola TaxID=798071 RepID=A0A8K0RK62_9PLEO|nr:general substrate transporter [Paraphoma chrysanthemicola]
MAIPPQLYQFLVGVFASLGSFTYGYDLGVIGGSVATPSFNSYFHEPQPNQVGAVVSLFTGGGFFGAFLAGPSADFLGRRLAIIVGAIAFILGGVLQSVARNLSYLYSGRAVAGFGVGYLVMIVPLYQAEIAHPSIRGRITALQQLMLGIGAVVATWLTHGTNTEISGTNNNQWRIPLGIQVIPAGILASMILLFPESPRWLIDHGKKEEGLRTLARLHSNGDINDTWVQQEYNQIEHAIAIEHEQEAKGYKDLFTDRSSFRRLFLVTAIQASVQMTGVSAIQYYTPQIYETLNIGTGDALKYQGISNVLSVVAQACTVALIDRIGRRWPLIIGNIVNGICWIVVVIAIALFPSAGASQQNRLGWTFICINWVYQVSFSFTCGPLSWIIPAEVFDTKTRSKGVSLGVMTSFAFNTMIGQVTPIAMASVGWRYFLTFVICNFTNAVFFWATLPETARLPLEEMNTLFAGKVWFVAAGRGKVAASNGRVRHAQKDFDDKEAVAHTEQVE